ncbi:competence protein CoiA [Phenylobacterium sp.]|uniref:competence protein CoiA n=1 Tax=Phenylobacterium sp. TaxID=1871053 RepID=UPI0035228E7C
MLTARAADGGYVEAAHAVRGVAYACRGCGAPVILHAGRIRPWHFQHRPDAACAFGSRMSEAHLNAQRTLAAALRARGVHVELEAWLPSLDGDRRIDVLAHPAEHTDRRVAIEVQQIDITVEAISARTSSYRTQGVAPLWLRLADFARFDPAGVLAATGEVWIERYAARSWERWWHDQVGALWFYDLSAARLWRGRFVQAFGWREGSEFYEAGGMFQSYPGGYHPVTRWVGLALEGPYTADALRLARGRIQPAGGALSAWFVPPDGTISPWPIRRELRTELRGNYLQDVCELEQCVERRWLPAEIAEVDGPWRLSGTSERRQLAHSRQSSAGPNPPRQTAPPG